MFSSCERTVSHSPDLQICRDPRVQALEKFQAADNKVLGQVTEVLKPLLLMGMDIKDAPDLSVRL